MKILELDVWKIKGFKKERIRDDYGDIIELAESLKRFGQLVPILVRPLKDDDKYDYIVVDGDRRLTALMRIFHHNEESPKLKPDTVQAILSGEEDELYTLQLEFHTNDDRKDFTWQEKSNYVHRIHAMLIEQNEKWEVYMTAAMLNMSEPMVYKYLELTKDEELLEDESVQEAATFSTAYKKLKIAGEKRRRKHEAKARTDAGVTPDAIEFAVDTMIAHADARQWIKEIPDESLDWFHLDPPYGGEQSGGARPMHKEFDDSPEYAWGLIRELLPEIWRTLKDGSWLAIWYNPRFHHRLVGLLQGHEIAGGVCKLCGKTWDDISLDYICSKSPRPMWVNPYPYIWHKVNRMSDGHEITRFSVNAYEPFILAGKTVEVEPILMNSMTQNVLRGEVILKSERIHVTQKPVNVLMQILSIISVAGSQGADACAGSGTIIEAALRAKRGITACEIDEDNYLIARESAKRGLDNYGKELPNAKEFSQ